MTSRCRLCVLLAVLGCAVACDEVRAGKDPGGKSNDKKSAAPKFKAGRIQDKAIAESSGIVASRKYPGVFWTHNDSGNGPVLFAITLEGELLGAFPVSARNNDWEDIAIDDDGRLYIADVGNNERVEARPAVYRVDEPDPRQKRWANDPPLRVNAVWRLRYPGKPFDCESLFVHKGRGYLISKSIDGERASVYSFGLEPQTGPAELEPVCTLPVRSPVTAADVSPDGERLAVMSVMGPYVFRIGGDVARAAEAAPAYVRYLDPNMEAVCFVPEGLVATNERGQILLFANKYLGDNGPTAKPAEPQPASDGE